MTKDELTAGLSRGTKERHTRGAPYTLPYARAALVAVPVFVAWQLATTPAGAQNIDTFPQWNGTTFISAWGLPNTATYGQTITPINNQTVLTSFTFDLSKSGTPPQFQAYVYQWDGSKITGQALFSSSVMTAPSASAFTPVTINTGDVKLTPGQQYVLFFTTSSVVQGGSSSYKYAALSNNTAYTGGNFVFQNNGTNFNQLSTVNWSFIPEDLAFDATFLSLLANLPTGAPLNPTNVATTLDNFLNGGGTLPPNLRNLYNLTGADLTNALTQIDGENATGPERGAFSLMNEFLNLMLDPFVYGRGDFTSGGTLGFAPDQADSVPPDIALAYAGVLKAPPKQPFAQRWTAWGSGFGGSATANGNATVGSNNVTTGTFGYAAGMDYHYSADTVFGFALAGGGTNWNLAQGLGTGRSDAFLAGVYGVTHHGPAYLAASLAFANNWFTTNRTSLGDTLTANFQGQSYAARFEAGYRYTVPINHGSAGLTPYAAAQVQQFHTPTYSETDLTAGGFGLSYAAMTGTDTLSELGARFDDPTRLGNMPLVLRAKLAWAHDWVSNPALNATFESLPGTGFTVFGAPLPSNSALTSAGAQLFFTPNWTLLAKFDGEFASGSRTYAGSGTVRYTW